MRGVKIGPLPPQTYYSLHFDMTTRQFSIDKHSGIFVNPTAEELLLFLKQTNNLPHKNNILKIHYYPFPIRGSWLEIHTTLNTQHFAMPLPYQSNYDTDDESDLKRIFKKMLKNIVNEKNKEEDCTDLIHDPDIFED